MLQLKEPLRSSTSTSTTAEMLAADFTEEQLEEALKRRREMQAAQQVGSPLPMLGVKERAD